jgi:hypothetical protein
MELGGPEVGRGCGGRGIIHGFETLEKLGFHDWGFDYVLLDFLGDVVCGGFGLPIARDMCQKVIVVGSNDLQSLYVANNVCSAVEYFRKLGGNVGVAGMVINKDDGTGEAQAFAANAGIPVLAAIPAHEDIRRKSASYEIIGRPGTQWAPLFEELATNVAEAPPVRPAADAGPVAGPVLGRVTGRDFKMEPATLFDMVGKNEVVKPTLEVDLRRRLSCPSWTPARHPHHPRSAATTLRAALREGRPWLPRRRHADAGRRAGCRQERGAGAVRRRLPARGPHDQPQSMCPAFGSLRVGLRMRRTATILSGSACCVYGLTFTSHFYGARRSVGYVPFNSESLVTGKLFEDIREAVHRRPTRRSYDAIVIINLCVPTASGVPLQLLPQQINGVRIIGIDVPGFGVPTHAEAKDVLAGAMLRYARTEAEAGPVAAPRTGRSDKPTSRCWARCSRPTRWASACCWSPWAWPPARWCPRANGASCMPRWTVRVVAALHPFYTASVREFEAAGRPVVGSAPGGP